MLKRESRAPQKIPCGIETELGVNRLDEKLKETSHWDFFDEIKKEIGPAENLQWDAKERILYDATEDTAEHQFFFEPDWLNHGNIFLQNGARLYVDMGPHVEISTPTCLDPKMLLVWNRAGYRLIDLFRKRIQERTGKRYIILRNNVARCEEYGNPRNVPEREAVRTSFGSHLNVTVERRIPEEELIIKSVPFFIFLAPIAGQGKVGSDRDRYPADFQISQRADWFVYPFGIMSTSRRGIYNRRDNPYADRSRFRRVHIVFFDSNMLELPEYLKIGLCSIFYMMIHDGALDDRFDIIDPVKTMHAVSRDVELAGEIKFAGKKRPATVVDCLKEYRDLFWDYLEAYHPDNAVLKDVLARFDKVLEKLARRDWEDLTGDLDWVTKKEFIAKMLARKGKGWQDNLAYGLDYQYSDNNLEEGFFYRVIHPASERIIRPEEDTLVEYAMREPPPTRSCWMKKASDRYREFAVRSDYWYKITFKLPERSPRMFHLVFPDPHLQWNEELTPTLFHLPFPEFLQKITESGIAKIVELNERELNGLGKVLPPHLDRNWPIDGLSVRQIVREAKKRHEFHLSHHWWLPRDGEE